MKESASRALLASLLLTGAALEPGAQDALAVGQPHPALRLPTIDGARTLDLAELRGKKVLLIEFASW